MYITALKSALHISAHVLVNLLATVFYDPRIGRTEKILVKYTRVNKELIIYVWVNNIYELGCMKVEMPYKSKCMLRL